MAAISAGSRSGSDDYPGIADTIVILTPEGVPASGVSLRTPTPSATPAGVEWNVGMAIPGCSSLPLLDPALMAMIPPGSLGFGHS